MSYIFKKPSEWTDTDIRSIRRSLLWGGIFTIIASIFGITSITLNMLLDLRKNDPKLLKEMNL